MCVLAICALKMCWNTNFTMLLNINQVLAITFCKKDNIFKTMFCCNAPLDQNLVFFVTVFFGKKTLMLNNKNNLTSENKTHIKGIEREQDRKPKIRKVWWKANLMESKLSNWIFRCCSFMTQKERNKANKQTDKKKPSKIKQKHKRGKEEKNKRERERDRERESEKGKLNKELGRNKGRHWKINNTVSFGGKQVFSLLKAKKGKHQKKETKQIRRVYGQVRRPFGPPRPTLKPCNPPPPKKKNTHTQKHKKNWRKTWRNTKQIPQNGLFNCQSKFSFMGGSKICLFWQLEKHYQNRGFSKPKKQKQLTVTKRPFLGLFLLFKQQKHKKFWSPGFCSVLANINRKYFKN